MLNLLKADLFRLAKDKPVKVIVIIMLVMNLFSMSMFKIISLLGGATGMTETITMLGQYSFFALFGLSNLGLLIAVAGSLFLGKDLSQNTIRGKIVGGNARLKIFLSALTVNLIIGLALFVLTLLEGSLLGLAFYGVFPDVANCLKIILLYIPLYLAFISVMTFISLSVRTQTMGIVLNVLVVILIPSLLQVAEMANAFALNNNKVVEWLLSVCPYQIVMALAGGMTGAVQSVSGAVVAKTLISSVILIAIAVGVGYAIFRRADIK